MQQFPKHRPKQIEFVRQKFEYDCGIACVAMLTGNIYEYINMFFENIDINGGLYPDDIFDVIEELGYTWKEVNSIPIRGMALVAIKWKDLALGGHYVVWDSKRKQFLDPLNGLINKNDMLKFATIDEIWKIYKNY